MKIPDDRKRSPLKPIINRRIKERQLKGIQELSSVAGIPYTTLYSIARGRRDGGIYNPYKPSLKTVQLLAKALDMHADEITYLYTVAEYDEHYEQNSPLFPLIQTEMLERYRLSDEGVAEFAEHEGLVPEVIEAVFFGGKDGEGRLAQPPISTLIDLGFALNQQRSRLMRMYAKNPNSNHMFFGTEDINKMASSDLLLKAVNRAGEAAGQPQMRHLAVQVAGAGSQPAQEPQEHLWLEESFVGHRHLAAFRIRGDSMEGGKRPIFDGDLVIVDCDDEGQDSTPVVAHLKNNGYVCKQLKKISLGSTW